MDRVGAMALAVLALGGCHWLFPYAGHKTDATIADHPVPADRAANLPDVHASDGSTRDRTLDRRQIPDKPTPKADRLPDKPSATWDTSTPCSPYTCTSFTPNGCNWGCPGAPVLTCSSGTCTCTSCSPACVAAQCKVMISAAYLCEQCYEAVDAIAACCAH